jgi:hypothetical protein
MRMLRCSKCQGGVEKIIRAGEEAFFFCRACKLPHDALGNPLFTTKSLANAYNPLLAARKVVGSHHKDVAPVTKTALEVALIQSLHEAYMTGLKEGVLLAYSQDVGKGEPL